MPHSDQHRYCTIAHGESQVHHAQPGGVVDDLPAMQRLVMEVAPRQHGDTD